MEKLIDMQIIRNIKVSLAQTGEISVLEIMHLTRLKFLQIPPKVPMI